MWSALARWAKALARIILRRMTVSGVPVNREQRRKMARELYRDVQRYRRNAAAAAVEEIRAEFPKVKIPPVREYPIEAVEKALANAIFPPAPVRASAVPEEMPSTASPEPDVPRKESEREQPAPETPAQPETRRQESAQESRTAPRREPAPEQPRPRPRARVTTTGESEPKPRATVSGPDSSQPRPRATVTGPDSAAAPRRRVTVSQPAELDTRSRRQGRARVIAPTPQNRTSPAVVTQVAARVSATLERHMRQAARDLTVDAAEGAGDEMGWARVLSGAENCAFCAMLASRGPVYHSDKSALTVVGQQGRTRGTRALGESYHDHCDCRTVLVRKGKAWDGQADFEHLERFWFAADALAGEQGESARLVFNRMFRRLRDDPDFPAELERFWESATSGVSEAKKRRAFGAALRANPPAALEAARRPRRAAA